MKVIKRILVAGFALLMSASAFAGGFRIGPRVGIDVNSLRFNETLINSDNRAGFTGGVQVEFTVPVINLGFDASVMYTRRNADAPISVAQTDGTVYKGRDYINIPINFKYKLGLPAIGKIITPYVFTGPDFAFLASKRAASDAWNQKKVDIAWNVGLGVELISHLQIGASYGFGITKAVETVSSFQGQEISGRNNYWTVTAAWLF